MESPITEWLLASGIQGAALSAAVVNLGGLVTGLAFYRVAARAWFRPRLSRRAAWSVAAAGFSLGMMAAHLLQGFLWSDLTYVGYAVVQLFVWTPLLALVGAILGSIGQPTGSQQLVNRLNEVEQPPVPLGTVDGKPPKRKASVGGAVIATVITAPIGLAAILAISQFRTESAAALETHVERAQTGELPQHTAIIAVERTGSYEWAEVIKLAVPEFFSATNATEQVIRSIDTEQSWGVADGDPGSIFHMHVKNPSAAPLRALWIYYYPDEGCPGRTPGQDIRRYRFIMALSAPVPPGSEALLTAPMGNDLPKPGRVACAIVKHAFLD